MPAPRLVIGDVVGVFPSRVHTCYLTRPRLGRSKSALKSCLFPKRRRKTLKCAGLFDQMWPFRKNRSKDLHYRSRIKHFATFSKKDLHYRSRIKHFATFSKKDLHYRFRIRYRAAFSPKRPAVLFVFYPIRRMTGLSRKSSHHTRVPGAENRKLDIGIAPLIKRGTFS